MTSTDSRAGLRELEQAIAVGREIGDAGVVALWSSNLSDALIRLGRFDEAAAAAADAIRAGMPPGALRHEVGFLHINESEALLLAGRWDESEQALDRVHDQRTGGLMELWGLGSGALLHAVRGDDDAAARAIADAAALGVVQAEGTAALAAARAHLALHRDDLGAAHRAVVDALGAVAADESDAGMGTTIPLAELALRVEADRAQLARARGDPAAERDAVETTRTVAERTLAQCLRAAAAAHRPEVRRAHRALADAEVGRAEGRSEPDAWRLAADASPGMPHRTAYAWFREAEAVLSSRGDRSRAIEAISAAHVVAGQIGAEPLRREIEGLARRARIELGDPLVPGTGGAGAEPAVAGPAPAPLGLTAREVDVLRLLAAGYTNPQIGEALYISRKTASHHVSSLLAKLGVRTRVEAAGVAHRLGLTPDSAAPQ